MARQRSKIALRGLVSGVVCCALLVGACNDSQKPQESPKPAPQVTAVASPAPPPAALQFTDVTAAAGVVFRHEAGATGKKWYPETIGAGGGFFDYDGDGWLDMLLVNGRQWPGERQEPEPTMRLYRNQGDGTFLDVTHQSGLEVPLYGMGMVAADYDNNGTPDLLITGYRETQLFRNEGNGTFTDITPQAGIAQGNWSTAAAFVDVDRDGWLDLVIGAYVDWDPSKEANLDCTYGTPAKDYCAVKYFRGQGLKLYRNLGDGRFEDISARAGIVAPEARVLGITIVDYNQDGWPDILVANDLTPSLFFANQGNGTFRELGAQTGLVLDEGGSAYAGMGIDAAYINNDTQLCVAIGNFTGQPTTLHCQARVEGEVRPDVFIEQSHRAGIAAPTLRMVTFGLFFFDADLDGWPDLFMVNGHVVHEEHLRHVPYAQRPQLFWNRGNGTFAELQPGSHPGLAMSIVGRGAAYADYDHDGDLDLLLTTNQGAAYLLRNDTPRMGHFLRVVTQGTRSNRDGIGARLRLYTTRRQLTGMVHTGSSYLSQSTTALTFGLASDERPERLEIAWPAGGVEVLHNLPLDTTFVAREGITSTPETVAAQPTVPDTTEAFLALKRTAVAYYQAGRRPDAIAAWQQVLQRQPTDYIAQQYLIELYWQQGQRAAALAFLETLRQTMPDANFLMQFAFHLEDVQLHDLADQVYRAAAHLDQHLAEAPYRLGKNALHAGRYEEAIGHFQQALQRHPGLVDAVQGIGLAYAEQGQTAQAEAQFQAVLRLVPDFAEAYTHLGKLYARTGRLDQAATAYRTVIKLQPDQAQGYHNLGAVLAAQGQTDAAIAQFQEALRHNPHLLAAHNDLGTLYAERGELARAIPEFQAAVHSDATSVPAHYNLALAYGTSGDLGAMQRELQETLRLNPRHPEAHLNLGIGYLQQGEAAAAVRQFHTLAQLAPQMANAHYFLAVAYAQNGQAEAMLAPLQQAVRLDPEHARAHSTLAAMYLERQQYDLAWQHAQQAAHLGAPVQPLLEALRRVREQAR
jgi:tetratricopeptide (TPR) repeat protein